VVNFSPAIPANNGTAYFGLEDAIQTQCSPVTLPSPPLYQNDPKWGSTRLGPAWSTVTIAEFGCYLTDLATEINYFAQRSGVSFKTDPPTLNSYLIANNGFLACNGTHACVDLAKEKGLIESYAAANKVTMNVGSLDTRRDDFTVDQYLCQQYPPMLWVGASASGPAHHWLVAYGQSTVTLPSSSSVASYSVQDPFDYVSGGLASPYVAPYGNTLAPPVWNNTYSGYHLFSDTFAVSGGLYVSAGGWFNWIVNTLSTLLTDGAVYDLVVTAPDGTKVGYNPQTSTSYRTIAGAGYAVDQIGDATQSSGGNITGPMKYVSIPGAANGNYTIEVYGTGTGTYGLNVLSYDITGKYTEVPLTGSVTPGSYEKRTFSYSSAPKTSATVALSNLTQTYTGAALAPSAATTPSGLSVSLYYVDQSGNPVMSPTKAGIYTAVATINDTQFVGTTSGTFTINQVAATVTLGNLTQAYSGSPITPTVTTTPSGLATLLSYNGSSAAPTVPGTYTVTASISDPNYTGTATGTLTITYSFTAASSGESTETISKGDTATYTLTLTPPSGTKFPFEVDFTTSGLPAGATATFSPSKIAPGSSATTVTLSVATTTSIAANGAYESGLGRLVASCLLVPFLGLFAFRRRAGSVFANSLRCLLILLIFAAISFGLSACAGNSPPQTFNFNVTATSGAAQQSIPLVLIVK